MFAIAIPILPSLPPSESTTLLVSATNTLPSSAPYVKMFQIQTNSTDLSPWLLYPATDKTVWVVTWQRVNATTLLSQIVNFTLGAGPERVATLVNAVPNDIVYDNITTNNGERVWILENDSLAYYNPATNNITIAWTFPENSSPAYMAIDHNDRFWITLPGIDEIAEYQVGGEAHYYPINDSCIQTTLGCGPWGITIDPRDGSIWFAEAYAGRIGHMVCTTWPLCSPPVYYAPPSDLNLYALVQVTVDQNGIVWFTVHTGNEFGSFDPSTGEWKLFPTGYCQENCELSLPNAISLDSNGEVWFAEHIAGEIGRYNPDDNILVEYVVPIPATSSICGSSCIPLDWWMWPGPGNLVWFVAYGLGEIGYVNASVPIPYAVTSVGSITVPRGGSTTVKVSATYAGEAPPINAEGTYLDVSSRPPMLSFSPGTEQVSANELIETSTVTISAAWISTLGSRYIAVTANYENVTLNTFVKVDVVAPLGAYATIGFATGIFAFSAATIVKDHLSNKKRSIRRTQTETTPQESTVEDGLRLALFR